MKTEKIGDITTTPDYWDCDCDSNFHRPAKLNVCLACGAVRDESPDSRVDEIRADNQFYADMAHLST